jgi:hypothetical protein
MTRVRACEPYGIPLGKRRLKAALDLDARRKFLARLVLPAHGRPNISLTEVTRLIEADGVSMGRFEPVCTMKDGVWSPAQGRPVLKP